MASKLSLRALSMRTTTTTLTPLNRLRTTAAALSRGPHCRASFSDKATSGADAAPPLSAATEAWIAKLKEMHGDRWQSVYDESRARQARNEELIREKHRQQQQLKQMKKGGKKAKAAAAAAAAAGTKGEGQGGAEGRVGQTEEAWIEQLKARHGERGWRAVYEQRKAAFEAGTAKSDRAAELLREKSRAEKKARQQEERRLRVAEEAKAKMEAELRGK